MFSRVSKYFTVYAIKRFIAVLLIYLAIVVVAWEVLPIQSIITTVKTLGVWGPIAFIALYVIRGLFNFPTAVFLVASSIVFPLPQALIYYFIAVALSIATSYTIGRLIRKHSNWLPYITKKIDEKHIMDKFNSYGYFGIFLLDLTGLTFDLPNYAAGYFKLTFWKLFIATFTSSAITTVIYYVFFVSVSN